MNMIRYNGKSMKLEVPDILAYIKIMYEQIQEHPFDEIRIPVLRHCGDEIRYPGHVHAFLRIEVHCVPPGINTIFTGRTLNYFLRLFAKYAKLWVC